MTAPSAREIEQTAADARAACAAANAIAAHIEMMTAVLVEMRQAIAQQSNVIPFRRRVQ